MNLRSAFVESLQPARRRAEQLLTEARNTLERRVTERTGELVRANEDLQNTHVDLKTQEEYLAQAQSLSHTGSFGWRVSTGEIFWMLDLDQVTLVDVDAVQFLGACRGKGITIVNCPRYIREWMLREQVPSNDRSMSAGSSSDSHRRMLTGWQNCQPATKNISHLGSA